METIGKLLVFLLEGQRYGLPLSAVDRVVRAAEITPLPKSPEIVLGVVNVQGRVIAVINLRRRFRLPERDMALTDQMVVARTPRRSVALVADEARGVVEYSESQAVGAQSILRGLEYIAGAVKLDDGLILIQDLDRLLSLDEETVLDGALQGG